MSEKGPREVELTDEEVIKIYRLSQEKRDKKLKQAVEKDFSKEMLESIEHISHTLDEIIKRHLLGKDNKEDADKTFEIWRNFTNSIYERLFAENLHNPEMIETVLKMATAVFQPEYTKKGAEDVKEGLKITKGRYGGSI